MVTATASNDPDPDARWHRQRRRRQRRRRADSRRYVAAPIVALAAAMPSYPAVAAGPCGDSPTYVSPMGLTCSQHASLDVGCEVFGSIGMQEDHLNALLQNCPRACRTLRSSDDDCDDETSRVNDSDGVDAPLPELIFPRSSSIAAGIENLAMNGKQLNKNRVLNTPLVRNQACHAGWDRTCQDDPSYRSKYGHTCANHQKLDCEAFDTVGFTEWEVFELVVACPCSCGVPCGTYTEAPSASPSAMPTEDFYRCTDPTCQDDPTYLSRLSLGCENHARFDCSTMDAIGYSDEELLELFNRCPCSCRTMCGDYTLSPSGAPSESPTVSFEPSTQPTISFIPSSLPSVSSIPSNLPSARPSVAPSLTPTNVPSFSPSAVPTESQYPSSRPSLAPSISFEPSGAPTVSFSASPSSEPTLSPSRGPSTSPSASPSNAPSTFPTIIPTSSPSTPPTRLPSSSPSILPSAWPTIGPTWPASEIPSESPSPRPTKVPSPSPSAAPIQSPTSSPTDHPTWSPSQNPTPSPSFNPSSWPTTQVPTENPAYSEAPSTSSAPSVLPSQRPTQLPSPSPSFEPSSDPSTLPSSRPSALPSRKPSSDPSTLPSSRPSALPSRKPSITPSLPPSVEPSAFPTFVPSNVPSSHPSVRPSLAPTESPSISEHPTPSPSTARSIGVYGTARISGTGADGEEEGGMPSKSSKGTSILAILFSLTMVGGLVYLLSKKYPGRFNRINTILRVAMGDDLVDIVSEASPGLARNSDHAPGLARNSDHAPGPEEEKRNSSAEAIVENGQRKVSLTKHNSFGSASAKSAVTFARNLVTVIPISSPARMPRSVSFAESIDDYLGSSSRSHSYDSSGTFDSVDESFTRYDRSGGLPFFGFGITSPTPRNLGDAWFGDDYEP